MLRKILGVLAGYIVMMILTFALLTAVYNILGADGVFLSGTYVVTAAWLGGSLIVTLLVAITGGYVAKAIGKTNGTVRILAGLVFVLGMIIAAMILFGPVKPFEVRPAGITMFEAIAKIQEPIWVCLVNPVVCVIGILIGGMLKR
jgi:hypothetical protein